MDSRIPGAPVSTPAVASARSPSPHAPMTFACRNASCSRTVSLMSASAPVPPASRTASYSIDRVVSRGPLDDLPPGALGQHAAGRADHPDEGSLRLQRGAELGDSGEVGLRAGDYAHDASGDWPRHPDDL